jgi:hypothetical protein
MSGLVPAHFAVDRSSRILTIVNSISWLLKSQFARAETRSVPCGLSKIK